MSRPRSFDYEEAARRHAAGESIRLLAREFGVSHHAMHRAVNPEFRARADAASYAFCVENYYAPCKGGCGRKAYVGDPKRPGYCPQCSGLLRRTAEHGTESKYSQGCRCAACRAAARIAKRRRREKTRVPCSHDCGRMVDSINRRTPEKPPECAPCSNARINGKLAA